MSAAAVAALIFANDQLLLMRVPMYGQYLPARAVLSNVSAACAESVSVRLLEKDVIELLAKLIKSVREGVAAPSRGFVDESGFVMVNVASFRLQVPPQKSPLVIH